jgi:hypothetical protein
LAASLRCRAIGRAVALLTIFAVPTWGQETHQGAPAAPAHPARQLTVTVTDENGKPVPGAIVFFGANAQVTALHDETDVSGHVRLNSIPAGIGEIRVDKTGFYESVTRGLKPALGSQITVVLHHVQEFHEQVQVTDSPPLVDPAQTASRAELTNRQLFSLPYPTTRDFRQALPFIPQVLLDQNEQIHVAGAAAYELYDELDGFNITHPVSGLLNFRLSPDALRLINVQTSRYSAEYGKGSGGVMQLESGTPDDHFRFTATNFTPGLSFRNGITFENVTPRLVFSGPMKKGRAWWFEGLDGEYDTNIQSGLPSNRDQSPLWRVNSLSKVQVNLTPSNILTASALFNHEKDERVGLSLFTPPQSTTDQHHNQSLFGVKDSAYFANQALIDSGVGISEFETDTDPRGSSPYQIFPFGAMGSFFETSRSRARRTQGFLNAFLPPARLHGRHEFKVGTDLDTIKYHQSFLRQPILIYNTAGVLQREATFFGPPIFGKDNFEASGYAQDRWSVTDRWLLEYGVRGDWDEIIRDFVPSPRFATTYMLSEESSSKLSFGTGIVYDVTNLDFVTRSLQGSRIDQNFAANGITPLGVPIVTTFAVDPRMLKEPRFLNTSASYERMLPKSIYMRLDLLDKRGRHGFDFVNESANPALGGIYRLTSGKNDRYDSVALTLHKRFAVNHEIFGSYARSVARSNAVLDFTLDNPLFAQQGGGPLAWDAPNRLISWGWLPLSKQFDLAYSLDWRTGFPFSAVNNAQQLVGIPNSYRFPDFFTLDLHLEHRFKFSGYEWAVRLGFNNITGHKNPAIVNNDIQSPEFRTFSVFQKRALTARIRLLGKK